MKLDLTRRKFLGLLAGGAAAVVGSSLGCDSAESQPNILLITADDMGITAGCYGDTTVPTPRMDRLASEGIRFERAYVTQASCSPSRSSIFTGLYPHQNGQLGLTNYGYTMHRGIPTLPSMLRHAGYRAGVIGKVHVEPRVDLPFDRSIGQVLKTRDIRGWAHHANAFIDESKDRPWFLLASIFDPHRPYRSQVEGLPEIPVGPDEITPFAVHGEIDTPEIREEVAGYYNAVQRVDIGVGMLMDVLDQKGMADNTLVIFVGDHGPPFSRGKTTTYEFGTRIPFLVRWPGKVQNGQVRADLVSTIDIMPTCLEATGIQIPRHCVGRSLSPFYRPGSVAWREYLCTEFNAHGSLQFVPQRAIRDDRYKLIHNLLPGVRKPGIGVDGCKVRQALEDPKWEETEARRVFRLIETPPEFELYDLQADPIEYHNLAGNPEHAAVEDRLKQDLLSWRTATNDPLLDSDYFRRLKAHTDETVEAYRRAHRAASAAGAQPPSLKVNMTAFQKDWPRQ